MKSAGTLLLGTTAGGLATALSANAGRDGGGQNGIPELPWPYKKLNAEATAEAAYELYYKGGCCYGVFESIIGALRREIGPPFTTVPSSMMVFGAGGVAGVGTVCGALNGAAAAIFLLTGKVEKEKHEPCFAIVRELFYWYAQTMLPNYRPAKPKFDIPQSVSRSNLCHVSVSRWCKATRFKSHSKERSDRCAWLTASVAKRAVEVLNANFDGSFKAAHKLPDEAQSCRGCHDKGGAVENTRGMFDCRECHFILKPEHPKL